MGLKDDLKKQYQDGKLDFKEYQRLFNSTFPASFMRDDGKIISHTEMLYGPNHKRSAQQDWDNILEVDQTNEARDIELEDLKNRQVFYHPTRPGVLQDQHGQEVDKKDVNLIKRNSEIRKRVKQVLKTDEATNKFMTSKTWEQYKYNRDKKSMPYSTLIDKKSNPLRVIGIQNNKLSPEDKLYTMAPTDAPEDKSFDDLNTIILRNSPEVNPNEIPLVKPREKTLEEIAKTEPDPDLNMGIGYLMGSPHK